MTVRVSRSVSAFLPLSRALEVLATEESNARALLGHGALPPLLHAIRQRGAAARLFATPAVVGLAAMCEQDQLRDAIVGAGGFELLLQLMVDTEGPMQVSAAHAVTIIVLHNGGDEAQVKRPKRWSKKRPPPQPAELSAEAIEAIGRMMNAPSSESRQMGLRAVLYLARSDAERAAFVDAGIAPVLVRMLYTLQAKIQTDVMRTLLVLAQNQELIGALADAGVERPVSVIMRHSTNKTLRNLARRTLLALDKLDHFDKLPRELAPGDPRRRDPEVLALVPVVGARRRELAFRERPDIEAQFSMKELFQFRKRFLYLDTDGSGALDLKEIQQLMASTGHVTGDTGVSTRKVRKLFKKLDKDQSGELEWEEYLQMCLQLKAGKLKASFGAMFGGFGIF